MVSEAVNSPQPSTPTTFTMKGTHFILLVSSLLRSTTFASPAPVVTVGNPRNLADAGPDLQERFVQVTVESPAGTIIGNQGPLVESFNGIPYAQPPVGDLRLRPPVRRNDTLVNFDATQQSPACPQFMGQVDSNDFVQEVIHTVGDSPFLQKALKVSEDCLNLNVFRPLGTTVGDKLPVLFWIYGGGFEVGWNSMYDATNLVSNSAKLGKPYIMVAVNYRLGGFGWLPGKEVKAAGVGNLGHRDQRMGMQWVADNIAAFGGDPDKVTIWGESAGSMSVANQMCLYDGDNKYNGKSLFRGAIMSSGSANPQDAIDSPRAQAIYDGVIAKTACQGQADTLDCLRHLPYDEFQRAVSSPRFILSYTSMAMQYCPRPDGDVLTASPHTLIRQGKYAAVPMINGDQEDEGPLFTLFQANTSSSTQGIINYLHDVFFPSASTDTIAKLVNTYPFPGLIEGSPFRTGIFNEIYPGFKRLSALIGDWAFTLIRRNMLKDATTSNPTVPAWSFLASYDYGTPVMGTFHASDIIQVFFGVWPNYAARGIQSYFANFVYNLDPNNAQGGTSQESQVKENWPQWQQANPTLNHFFADHFETLPDDFRQASADVIMQHADELLN